MRDVVSCLPKTPVDCFQKTRHNLVSVQQSPCFFVQADIVLQFGLELVVLFLVFCDLFENTVDVAVQKLVLGR